MDRSQKVFAPILAELMKRHNLKQAELAAQLGIMQSQVSNWLMSKSLPGYNSLRVLSRVFSVKSDQLLGLSPLDENTK